MLVLLLLAAVPAAAAEEAPAAAARVVFEGRRQLEESVLRQAAERELADFERHGGRPSDIDDAAYQMTAAYRRNGFPFAEVGYRIEQGAEGRQVTFVIDEGPRVELAKVAFEGNTVFTDKALSALVEKRLPSTITGGRPPYVAAEVQAALSDIRDLYRDRGYLEAAVEAPQVHFSEDRTRAEVRVRITEGRQSVIERVEFSGDLVPEAAGALASLRAELAGQPFFPRQRFTLQKRVLQVYGNLGYADAEVQVTAAAADTDGRVALAARIESGPQVVIDAVEVRGNERTRARLIRRRLLLKAGDTYSVEKKQDSFRALYRTGLFSAVDISLEGAPGAPRRKLVVTVTEAPAKELYVEPGWGSYEQLRLKFGFREANLAGTGRIFEATTKLSFKAQGARLSLVDPWFLYTRTTAELPVAYERREEPSFTREDLSAAFLLTRQLTEHLTLTGGWSLKRSTISEVEVVELDPNQSDDYNLASLKAQLGYDTRNDIFFPTRGHKGFLSAEYADDLLGGDISFGRLAGGWRYYLSLGPKTVLAMRYSTGLIIPGPDQLGVPLGERFFNGGENSVRSFEESQLGPKDASRDPVGGLAYNTASLELRRRLAGRLVGTIFVEAGNIAPNRSREELGKPPYGSRSEIWEDTLSDYFSDFRPAVGVGLQYMLPFGPARLDVALNPDRDKARGEKAFAWHFSIGAAF